MAASATLCNLVFSLATLASVSAVPMMPFSSGLMGMLGLGHGPFPGSGVAVDARSKAGASYSGSQDSSHDHQLSTPSPTILVGRQQVLGGKNQLIEGFQIVIEPAGSSKPTAPSLLPYTMAALYGGSYGGYMGALTGMLGGHGSGHYHDDKLQATIDVKVMAGTETREVLLVFSEASTPGPQGYTAACDPEAQGAVLTSPPEDHELGTPLGLYGGFHGPLGHAVQQPTKGDHKEQFGVIGTFTLREGMNTFKLQGLGLFTRIKQLAGRGANLCHDVVMGHDGRPYCTKVGPQSVVFCAKLSYALDPGTLDIPDPEDHFFNPEPIGDHPIL